MKILFLLSFLFLGNAAKSTTYYFASNGYDNNSGTSSSSPWQTISKLNSIMGSLTPGDNVLFNRGDVFFGSIIITASGTSANPIVFGAYGTGANPIITGLTSVNSWTKFRRKYLGKHHNSLYVANL